MLLDIGAVTQTLLNVLKASVPKAPVWPTGETFTPTPNPPDRLVGKNSAGLYLYHLIEDPQTKNLTPLPGARPDVRFTPMGLQLFYLLRAHSDITEPDKATLREQLIMGLSVK